jgi:hypothetical protein
MFIGAGHHSEKELRPLVRRNLLGLIALVLLGMATAVCLYPRLATYQAAGFMGMRIGMVLGVLWLAWPDLSRLPGWSWLVLPIGLVLLTYARSVFLYAFPLFAAALAVYLVYRKLRRSA